MKDYTFLDFEMIERFNRLAANTYGGAYGIRDKGLVESAINQPKATFGGDYLYKTKSEIAAAYFYHISESQGFVDGSTRTGFLALFAFLKLNDCDLIVPEEYLWPALKDVAKKNKTKEDLVIFLTQYVKCKDQ